jgi:hypothetical protein
MQIALYCTKIYTNEIWSTFLGEHKHCVAIDTK